MVIVSRKFVPGTKVDFYGEDSGVVAGMPYVESYPGGTETVVDVRWDSDGEVAPEYIWALKPVG